MSSATEGGRFLILGAETRLSRELNDIARSGAFGVDTRPMRLAVSYLESGAPEPSERAVFVAMRTLGGPFSGGAFFPLAEDRVGGVVASTQTPFTFVLTIAPLTDIHAGPTRDRMRKVFTDTPWERLYDASWADLVQRLLDALGGAPLLVLTPRGAALQSGKLMRRMFGAEVANPSRLMTSALTPAGRAAHKAVLDAGRIEAIPELYDRMAATRSVAEGEADLGLDAVTFDLLQDRFREDVARIARMPGVELV